MKKIIIIIFLIFNIQLFSQQITFNNVYNPYNKNSFSLGASIQKKGNGYITLASAGDTLNTNKRNVIFNEIDSIGNLIKIKTFSSNIFDYYGGGYGSLIQTSDGGYFAPCSKRYTSNNSDHFLIRFNSNMDTLWTKTIDHDTVWEIIIQACETHDKGFACIGYRVISETLWNVLIIKTDSLGNKQWEKTISLGNYSGGDKIIETQDKGLLISGYRSSYTQSFGGPFIIKTDSLGNLLWEKYLGGNEKDGGAAIAITKQGDYLVAYGYSTYTYPNNDAWLARLNVIKFSSNGNQIWNKMYDTIRIVTSINKVQVLLNDDFIVMGSNGQRNILDMSFHYESFLFRFNSLGDSLWRKSYYYSPKNVDQNFLYDNVLNQDGSITACGFASSDTMQPYQKIWIVKTDTNGYAPGCYPTGVEEYYYTQKGEIKIYPNPAKDYIIAEFTIDQTACEVILQINDMQGRILIQQQLHNADRQAILDIRNLKNGTYYCALIINGQVKKSTKIVVKH